MSQYAANFSQTTWTDELNTMLGLSIDFPASRRDFSHRRLNASPASMQASDDPIADVPIVVCGSGEFQRSARIWTHRSSMAAVCGYSSLSIMFLS